MEYKEYTDLPKSQTMERNEQLEHAEKLGSHSTAQDGNSICVHGKGMIRINFLRLMR